VDILKELSAEKDIVDLLQVRRMTYFGHVNRMDNDRFPKLLLHGISPQLGPDKMEKRCSQLVLPEREDNVFVAFHKSKSTSKKYYHHSMLFSF